MASYGAEVLNFSKRHADNSGNHADLWPLKVYHSTVAQLYFEFFLITQVPFHKYEWRDKKVEWPNRERQMSRTVPWKPCRLQPILHWEWFPAFMANHNGCISAQSSFILTSHGALHSSLNEETSHQRFITVHAQVQRQFCIDRKYIFYVNPSPHRPNTRGKTNKHIYKQYHCAADNGFP